MTTRNSTYIRAVGAWVPENCITNDELAQKVETSDEWIRSHTGIGSRHVADSEMATSDLAVKAVEVALKRAGMELNEIDGIVLATATPDFIGFPATACVIQQKLGVPMIPALDIAAGCTGFIYAVDVAKGLIGNGTMHNVLVIGAEKLSSIVDWEDRNTCILFGDGAGCVIVSAAENLQDDTGKARGIIDTILHADGTGSSYLMVPKGGSSAPLHPGEEVTKADVSLQMEGRAVYNFAVRVVGEVIQKLMERNNLTIEDIDWIVPHQANSRIIQAAAKRLKIDQSKFFMNIESYANTSAASIPIALQEMDLTGKLKPGDNIITVGFGAGLTYGGSYIVW